MLSLAAFIVVANAQASIPTTLPDTPTNHWFFQGFYRAKRGGLLVGHDDGFFRMRVVPRIELAQDVRYAMATYQKEGQRLLDERRHIVDLSRAVTEDEVQAYGAHVADYASLKSLLHWYARGSVEFRKEFAALGQVPSLADLKETARRVDELGPNVPGQRPWLFSDVPAGHWAARAVGDMRALGLLDGCPDGRFRG